MLQHKIKKKLYENKKVPLNSARCKQGVIYSGVCTGLVYFVHQTAVYCYDKIHNMHA